MPRQTLPLGLAGTCQQDDHDNNHDDFDHDGDNDYDDFDHGGYNDYDDFDHDGYNDYDDFGHYGDNDYDDSDHRMILITDPAPGAGRHRGCAEQQDQDLQLRFRLTICRDYLDSYCDNPYI